MNIELILVLIGLLMFGLFAWQRWVAGPEKADTQHLNVFANMGCVLVIIGFGALIIETISSYN